MPHFVILRPQAEESFFNDDAFFGEDVTLDITTKPCYIILVR